MRRLGIVGLAIVGTAGALEAQTVRIGPHLVVMTRDEGEVGKRADGFGFGATGELRFGRIRLEAKAHQASLSVWRDTDEDFTLRQVDVRGSFSLTPGIALEVGAGRSFIDPELAAQDVGFIRIGALSDNQVARIANIWMRGAYLAMPQFSGGGEATLALELGFGVGIGTPNGLIRLHAEYEFQRIDRRVYPLPDELEQKVPIQTAVARVGVEIGF